MEEMPKFASLTGLNNSDIMISGVFRRFFLLSLLLWAATLGFATDSKSALQDYLQSDDASFSFQVVDSTREADVRAYRLRVTSQTWRGIPWYHEMVVCVPLKVRHREALIHLTGGSEDEQTGQLSYHSWDDPTIRLLGLFAHNVQAVTAVIWQIPRQPLFGGMREDVLVSYTYHQFLLQKDYSWPLLLPMTKAALRALDVTTHIAASRGGARVDRFLVNGVSKRGWTTWMSAAAADPRIVAIAPMVIDILNMPVNVPYQRHMFGKYSEEIMDYVRLGITEEVSTEGGGELVDIVDPYSYRHLFHLPKMLIMGTNDEFWTVDAVKNYIDSIPGPTLMTYVPNAGHSLGDRKAAASSLEAFFYQTIHGGRYPTLRTTARRAGSDAIISVRVGKGRILKAEIWYAESDSLDFRPHRFHAVDVTAAARGRSFEVSTPMPPSGYKAFLLMLYYKHPVERSPYTITSRMYTASPTEVFTEAYRP